MKKLLVTFGLITAITSTGCTLYFGECDDEPLDCPPGTYLSYDEYGPVCITDDNPYLCSNDYECAAGCYCDPESGACIEAGFCTTDADCPEGTVCDESRQSCDPDGTPNTCSDDTCPLGSYCDEETGYCLPLPCASDEECAAGCYCDPGSGTCVESCYCTTDNDATSAGWGWCDEDRTTCMPGEDPKPACEELTTSQDCYAREDCTAIYRGLNCTDPNGIPCTEGSAECTCESFVFDRCETAE